MTGAAILLIAWIFPHTSTSQQVHFETMQACSRAIEIMRLEELRLEGGTISAVCVLERWADPPRAPSR